MATDPTSRKTWLQPRREFERTIEIAQSIDPVRYRLRIQQRSDGVLYYMTWEPELSKYLYRDEQQRQACLRNKRINCEQQWDYYLDDVTSMPPCRIGILNDGLDQLHESM